MGYKFYQTSTVTLAAGDNTIIPAPNPANDGLGAREHFIRRLWLERTDTATDVTLIIKNNAGTPRELMQRITLNSDAGKVVFEYGDLMEVGVGGGLALVVNASVDAKARVYVEYRTGAAAAWPA